MTFTIDTRKIKEQIRQMKNKENIEFESN